MARSRSRSSCRYIPPSVYCKGGKKRSRKGKKSRRRSRSRRSRRSSRRQRCGSKRRSSRRSRKRKRKCRPGPKTKNPFLNYLRVFRSKYCGWPQTKIAIEGAKCWCKMSDQQRAKFYKQACSMRKKGKRKRGRSRKRRSKRRKSKKRSCPT